MKIVAKIMNWEKNKHTLFIFILPVDQAVELLQIHIYISLPAFVFIPLQLLK